MVCDLVLPFTTAVFPISQWSGYCFNRGPLDQIPDRRDVSTTRKVRSEHTKSAVPSKGPILCTAANAGTTPHQLQTGEQGLRDDAVIAALTRIVSEA